jgi:multidrug efflux pump subunit AcrA (membrane-fusion protein)
MSARRFWEADIGAKFEVTIALTSRDERLRPGVTAHIVIHSDPHKNVLYVPRQALFMKDGKRVVFVRSSSGFEPREVKIQAENESRAAIEGLGADIEIALIDPTASRKSASASATAMPSGGGPF